MNKSILIILIILKKKRKHRIKIINRIVLKILILSIDNNLLSFIQNNQI